MTDSSRRGPAPGPLAGVGKDARIAVRRLLHDRGFTATALLTLALATGATTAVFTLVNAVLLKPLAYRDADRLVRIYDVQSEYGRASVSVPEAQDWAARSHSFSGLALLTSTNKNLNGADETTRVSVQRISAGAFRVLGLPPLIGREFTEDEDRAGGPGVVMLGERFWRAHFAGRPEVVGTSIRLDGRDHLVVGIAREQPHWGGDSDAWVPLQIDPATSPRGNHFLMVVGRLAPGVGVAAAQKELSAVAADVGRELADTSPHGVFLVPWADELLGEARG